MASESNRNGSAGNNGCEPALIQAPNYTWAESPMHKLLKCFLEQSAIFGAIRWVAADPNPQLCPHWINSGWIKFGVWINSAEIN